MKKRKIIAIIFLMGISMFSYSQRKYSNEFLAIGVGARALAMSNSVVASVDDATSGFWNPAGLALINHDLQIAAMHSEYFAGIANYDFGAVAKTMKDKEMAMSFTLIRFGVDDIPNTLFWRQPDGSFDDDKISSFSIADYGFFYSLSKQIYSYGRRTSTNSKDTRSLRVGANAKIVHRKAGPFAHSWGFGIDAGAQYYFENFRLGVMAKDITTTFNAWTITFTEEEKDVLRETDNEIPDGGTIELTMPKVILAAGYQVHFGQKISLLSEIDMDLNTDGQRNVLISAKPVSVDPHLGVEADYDNFIFLRGGLGNFQKSTDDEGNKITTIQPNIGVGLKIKNITIDYALSNVSKSLGYYSHVFSLKLGFLKQPKGKKKR